MAETYIYQGIVIRSETCLLAQTRKNALLTSAPDVLAEYALKGYNQPMGVSDYHLAKAIPEELKSQLPAVDDLEEILEREKV